MNKVIQRSAALLTSTTLALAAQAGPNKGIQVYLDSLPLSGAYVEQGVTLIPLRPVAQSLGLSLQWDASRRTATLTGCPQPGV